MDNIDAALEQLFYALLTAGPRSQAVALRKLSAPWQSMPRRKRIAAIVTMLVDRLGREDDA